MFTYLPLVPNVVCDMTEAFFLILTLCFPRISCVDGCLLYPKASLVTKWGRGLLQRSSHPAVSLAAALLKHCCKALRCSVSHFVTVILPGLARSQFPWLLQLLGLPLLSWREFLRYSFPYCSVLTSPAWPLCSSHPALLAGALHLTKLPKCSISPPIHRLSTASLPGTAWTCSKTNLEIKHLAALI